MNPMIKASLNGFISQIRVKLNDKIENFNQLLQTYTDYHNHEEQDNMTENQILLEVLCEVLEQDNSYIPKKITLNGWLDSFDTEFYDIVSETLIILDDEDDEDEGL